MFFELFYHRILILMLCVGAASSVACRNESGDERPPKETDAGVQSEAEGEGGFFDESALLDDTAELGEDFSVVPCAGASAEEQAREDHPRLVRGEVFGPSGRLAHLEPSHGPRVFDWLIPSAHAVPLESERPVSGARVVLFRLDPTNESRTALGETRTDALGRYCIRVPDGASFGPTLLVEASKNDGRLRRFLPNVLDGNISAQTEALTQLVLARARPGDLSAARLVNLHTMADTALDLLSPVSTEGNEEVAEVVARVKTTLQNDPRIRRALDEL